MSIPSAPLSNGSIPLLGLGTWRLCGPDCQLAVQSALKLGYRHIDTAEYYRNESDIGKSISGFPRNELFITSKVWSDHFSYLEVLSAADASLMRLGTDYLDLYLMHYFDDKVPLEKTLRGLKHLLDEGRIRNAGVSNFNVDQLKTAIALADFPIAVNQVEFHPYLFQKELLEFCTKNKIHVTAYCPVGRGIFFNDPILRRIAKNHRKSVAQISLRWLLQKGLSVIPKASKDSHLRENLEIFNWKLTPEDMRNIDSLKVKRRLVDLD